MSILTKLAFKVAGAVVTYCFWWKY